MAKRRFKWRGAPTRLAAILLLLVWAGPVSFVQNDAPRLLQWMGAPERVSAQSQTIPAGMAMMLEPRMPVRLRLRDGRIVVGRFFERTLLDSALYAPRFAAATRSLPYVPFALGETLRVSLRDGREWIAPFAGYAELTLLLRDPVGQRYLRAPFEFAREIHRANGDPFDPSVLAQAFRAGLLPSAEALVLERRLRTRGLASEWGGLVRVAVEDIESMAAELPSGENVDGAVVLGVLVGVVVFFILIARASRPQSPSCTSNQPPPIWGTVHLTTRPFDRLRGCFVGDPLVAADQWPGLSKIGPATALAQPSDLPNRTEDETKRGERQMADR